MKILFCGGGTFGHIAPALATATALKKQVPDAEIIFVGRKGGLENESIRRAGYNVHELAIQSVSKRFTVKNIHAFLQMLRACSEARKLLQSLTPDIVFGTGGYVCFPLMRAAQEKGIPTILHESNAVPGRACRMLASKCSKVLLGTRDCAGALPRQTPCEFTGNPVRAEFYQYTKERARKILGIPHGTKLLLSFGGSGGAQCLNDAMLTFMTRKDQKKDNIYHVHAIGKKYYAEIAKRYPALTSRNSRYRIYPFIENMPLYMWGADLCVCRSGAMTLAELAAAELPAILVPSPNVTENHQYKNALSLAQAGGALIVEEKEISLIEKKIMDTISDTTRLSSMRNAISLYGKKDATDRIVDSIRSILP